MVDEGPVGPCDAVFDQIRRVRFQTRGLSSANESSEIAEGGGLMWSSPEPFQPFLDC